LFAYSWREQVFDLLPYAALSAIMGVCVKGVNWLPLTGNLSLLIVQVVTGVVVYATGSWFWRVSAFSETCELLGSKLPWFKTVGRAASDSRRP
jgi:hypothetical protein